MVNRDNLDDLDNADRPTFRLSPWMLMPRSLLLWAASIALIVDVGFTRLGTWLGLELELFFYVLTSYFTLLALVRVTEHWRDQGRLRGRRLSLTVAVITIVGLLTLSFLPHAFVTDTLGFSTRAHATTFWCKLAMLNWILLGALRLYRRVSFAQRNPSLVLVASFAAVVLFGTLLLMLPFACAGPDPAPLQTALFTATSAVCVTGLIVENTGTYWSWEGQVIILGLIQIGGLGIMTSGAFFSLLLGRGMYMRESVLLGDILDVSVMPSVKRLVTVILVFTLVHEAAGAVLLYGTWPDLPVGQQIFFCIFHSVSAFCNAGFSLIPDFTAPALGTSFRIWGVLGMLVILGGLGFGVLLDLNSWAITGVRRKLHLRNSGRPRLHLTTKLVLNMTAVLLVGGTLGFLILEWDNSHSLAGRPLGDRFALSWFQSLTCRTAGFNTVDISQLKDSTKFWMIMLMFIGASPGSTGGGVKTVAVAISLLVLRSVLQQRRHISVFHRTIPEPLAFRALLIVALGGLLTLVLTLLFVAVENRPGQFLNQLFEVVSALSTVGLSTGVTGDASTWGRLILIAAMFLGRVGPLTLLVGLAGKPAPVRYQYPEDDVTIY